MRRSPDTLDAVSAKHGIGRHDGQVFDERLSDQETIEWISMVKCEAFHAGHVRELDSEQPEAVRRELLGDKLLDWSSDPQLVDADFDGHLPAAHQADEALGFPIGDRHACATGQSSIVCDPPQERVRVEQQALHA